MGISEGQQGGASPGSPLFLSPEENPSGSVRFPSWFTLAFFFLWKSVAASILHLGRLYWFHERWNTKEKMLTFCYPRESRNPCRTALSSNVAPSNSETSPQESYRPASFS